MRRILSKCADLVKYYKKDLFLGFCLVLISIIGYNLGRINAFNKTSDKTTEKADIYQAPTGTSITNKAKPVPAQPADLRVVASKASTSKKYHFTWCASGKRIAQKNQLWFENEEIAIKAGYTLAGNCMR